MEEQKQYYPLSKGIWNILGIVTQWVQVSTPPLCIRELWFKIQIPCLSLLQLLPNSYMFLRKYCILPLTANSRKNHIISPEPMILAILGTLPATTPMHMAQVLVPPFATSPGMEPVQSHFFSPGLRQLSLHRNAEWTFVVHIFPAKCLNMNWQDTERCTWFARELSTPVQNGVMHKNNALGTITPNVLKDSSAKYVINVLSTQIHDTTGIWMCQQITKYIFNATE